MSNRTVDKLGLRVEPRSEQGRIWETVDVFINDRRLIDMVREVELPFAQAEGHPDIAGGYIGLPSEVVFLPAHTFLGDPSAWFVVKRKPAILGCECGEPGCWPLLVRINLEPDRVIWSDFEQPHRPEWKYDGLGPFVFDREEYEAALHGPPRTAVGA